MSILTAPTTSSARGPVTFEEEVRLLEQLEQSLAEGLRAGSMQQMPGNAAFLADGRVLCRARARGDSRYPYGRDGFNFWVHASGYMYGNDGLFFLFLPFQEGQEPPIAFFLGQQRSDGAYLPLPLLPVPYIGASESAVTDRYTVFGNDAAYFAVRTGDVWAVTRIFVDQSGPERSDIAFSTRIENRSGRRVGLYLSAYMNMFCRHQFAETCEDRWFKQVAVDQSRFVPLQGAAPVVLPPFVVAVNEDVSRFRSVTNRALVRRAATGRLVQTEVCTSRRAYVGGPRAGLSQAEFLTRGTFGEQVPLTVFNDNAVVGDLHRWELAPGEAARFDYVLSLPRTDVAYREELQTPVSAAAVDAALTCCRRALADEPHLLSLRVSGSTLAGVRDETLNRFLPLLITQVRVCAQTKGYMQPAPNSLIGIRDVFQAIEGHLYDQPELTRDKIREALSFVLTDGRCPRQYSLPVNGLPGRADLREFIDQGAWVISALHTYLALTGDAALLNESVGYHKLLEGPGGGIAPAEHEQGSVLEHLARIMAFLDRNRDPETGLVYALYGDWNDAVDGLGTTRDPDRKFGTGVSVMASLQLYQNCREMIEILQQYSPGLHLDLLRRYQGLQTELETGLRTHAIAQRDGERRIIHGWGDRRSYYVGSFQDSDGASRDSLTSNAFWVLSGLIAKDASLRPHILAALARLDSPYGLRTFSPGFAPDAPGVGRVCKLPLGTAENGATYIHATAFGIMALFLLGEPHEAWRQIHKILPFAPHQSGLSHSPFVMPNSYVFNPALGLTGQNMNDWQTGSSNVLLKLLIRYVFGFQPALDELRIAPAAWCPCAALEFAGTVHGRRVRIIHARGDVPARRFKVNGQPVDGALDKQRQTTILRVPYAHLSLDRENTIVITDPAAQA